MVDEPQLGAGGFLGDKGHPWFSNHRWLLTGTPINATVETMAPSLEFLRLGTFDALYKHFPPVITHVLKASGIGGQGTSRPLGCWSGWHSCRCPGILLLSSMNLYSCTPLLCFATLQRYMVRYTKMGRLDGETNLKLPNITEKLVEVRRFSHRSVHPVHSADLMATYIASASWSGLN